MIRIIWRELATGFVPVACVGLVHLVLLTCAAPASAQPTPQQLQQLQQQQMQRMRQQGQQPNVEWENVELSGVIKGMQGSLIQVATSETEQWLVHVEARPQDVMYQGTADVAFVQPGMLVEFKAKVNKRGQAADPVTELAIFTVREGRGVGMAPEGGANASNLFGDAKEEKKPSRKALEDATYVVAGQVTKLSRGEMSVNCAGTNVKANLDKDAKVTIDVNHLKFAQVGDKVEMRARHVKGQKAAGQALATQVTVVGANPLGETKKRTVPAKAGDEKQAQEKKADEAKKAD